MADVENGGVGSTPATATGPTKSNKKLKKVWAHTPMEIFSGALATVSVGTSVTAIVMAYSPIVLTAGILSSVVGPYAYYQQTKLTDIIALKETHGKDGCCVIVLVLDMKYMISNFCSYHNIICSLCFHTIYSSSFHNTLCRGCKARS